MNQLQYLLCSNKTIILGLESLLILIFQFFATFSYYILLIFKQHLFLVVQIKYKANTTK